MDNTPNKLHDQFAHQYKTHPVNTLCEAGDRSDARFMVRPGELIMNL